MARRIHPVGGRVVLVTGAARGIGAESARRLALRGARVALLDVDAEALERVAAHWGGIDVAGANAGIAELGSARTMDPGHFERTLQVNLLGTWRTLHAALPHVTARRGYLLAICSLAAVAHAPGLAAYSASKAGLEAMCDSLRAELAHVGVDVGVAYFSWIDTEMVRGRGSPRVASAVLATARPPFHRIHPVSDAGRAVVTAVEGHQRRVFHPRWLRALLPLRGIVQPLLDREFSRPVRRPSAADSGGRNRNGGQ
jgi:NAD(P)-dependent dehydrogenase (short-subunit alcohol dehydrogenase family)